MTALFIVTADQVEIAKKNQKTADVGDTVPLVTREATTLVL